MIKKRFEFKSDEEKLECLKKIVAFFQDERGEEIGLIAAEKILDFFVTTMGEEIYKNSINETKKIVEEGFENMTVELNLLTEE